MIIKVFPNTNELKYSSPVSRGYLQKDLLAGSFAAFLDWLQHEMVGIWNTQYKIPQTLNKISKQRESQAQVLKHTQIKGYTKW